MQLQTFHKLSEVEILELLGPPVRIPVERHKGKSLPLSVPRYTVIPTRFPEYKEEIRLSGFRFGKRALYSTFTITDSRLSNKKWGSIAFSSGSERRQNRNHVLGSEAFLAKNPSEWDHRIDLWWLGSMVRLYS